MIKVENAVKKLEKYIESENYRGYDPYDGLTSPLFKLPILKTNKIFRLYFQQFIKRFPINLRPMFFIKKGCNPVTLGLCIQGYTYLLQNCHPEPDEGSSFITLPTGRQVQHSELVIRIEFLIDELIKIQSKGYSGSCWGYNFDWQSSILSIPAFCPTIVATGIITNALFEYYTLSGNEKAKELIISSSDFTLKDLNRTQTVDSFCFSYSPFDKESVYNANMKGVRLLAQAYSITKDEKLIAEAKKALKFVLDNQNEDGSWYYSNRSNDKRVDNYHTGYVLECLSTYIELTDDDSPSKNLIKGYEFYLNNFITTEGDPKFYYDSIYPIDSTSAAQTIITLSKFSATELAIKVAEYMIDKLLSNKGYFYFRRYKYFNNKTSFMRWSNAWMFLALSYLLKNSGD
jgi:hypothetical protein